MDYSSLDNQQFERRSQRVAFAESAASGRAVLENGGDKSPAAREIRALTAELLQLMEARA